MPLLMPLLKRIPGLVHKPKSGLRNFHPQALRKSNKWLTLLSGSRSLWIISRALVHQENDDGIHAYCGSEREYRQRNHANNQSKDERPLFILHQPDTCDYSRNGIKYYQCSDNVFYDVRGKHYFGIVHHKLQCGGQYLQTNDE